MRITIVLATIADRDVGNYFAARHELDRHSQKYGCSCFWLRGHHGDNWYMMLDVNGGADIEAIIEEYRSKLDLLVEPEPNKFEKETTHEKAINPEN